MKNEITNWRGTRRGVLLGTLALGAAVSAAAQRPAQRPVMQPTPPLAGRWDLTVQAPDGAYPSWLEVERSGYSALVGRFVHRSGSARPIAEVHHTNGRFEFTLPPQWEHGKLKELRWEGRVQGDRITGRTRTIDGDWLNFTGTRAPTLARQGEPRPAGSPIELFNGESLSGWKPRHTREPHGWVVEDGLLRNRRPRVDLVTTRSFRDFKLHVEFRYPKGSNSGIYLRGRHEVQVQDDHGRPPDAHGIGGVYGFIKPRVNAAKPAGQWQTMEITLVGRELTVELNGQEIICRQEIPGITGGALDSREGQPGPIMLQGDHGPIDFRAVTLTPLQVAEPLFRRRDS
ncbi:MAG: DUF1080 domain-containing protein [Armatimonadota bacterium]